MKFAIFIKAGYFLTVFIVFFVSKQNLYWWITNEQLKFECTFQQLKLAYTFSYFHDPPHKKRSFPLRISSVKLRISSHLLKKSLMKNFIFWAVTVQCKSIFVRVNIQWVKMFEFPQLPLLQCKSYKSLSHSKMCLY